jgi:hypothetical protein
MPFSHLYWEELVLFEELSDVEKHVFPKLFPNIPTPKLLFMSDVEKEEMKWLKS